MKILRTLFLLLVTFAGMAAASDVTGGITDNTVVAIQGHAIDAAAPTSNQVLSWNGTKWIPTSLPGAPVTTVFGRSGVVVAATNDYSFSQISGSVAVGQLPSITGDVTGTVSATVVAKIQGVAVSPTAPTISQVLQYDGTKWAPTALPAAMVTTVFGRSGPAIVATNGDYSFAQISGTATAGQLPSLAGEVTGAVGTTVVAKILAKAVSGTPTTSQALVYNGTGWAPAAVTNTVFGRSGAVIATTGDYSFTQISGTATDSQLAAGINASKIGTGTVTNAEFDYLKNVTSDIQTQLNAKASAGAAAAVKLAGGVRPACDVAARGSLWATFSAAGAVDVLEYCAKDGADAYAWHGVLGF